MSYVYDGNKLPSNRKNVMQNGYWLPPRKARLCRWAGGLFLLAAAYMLGVVAFAALTPGAAPMCDGQGCRWNARPTALLDRDVRLAVEATPATRVRFDAHVARPDVRLALAAARALDALPFGVLLLCVGVALRRLGTAGSDALAQALPWLRRASLTAIVWTILGSFYDSAAETILSPGTPEGGTVMLSFYADDLVVGALLSMAAYVAIWAVEAGLATQRDLENFV